MDKPDVDLLEDCHRQCPSSKTWKSQPSLDRGHTVTSTITSACCSPVPVNPTARSVACQSVHSLCDMLDALLARPEVKRCCCLPRS